MVARGRDRTAGLEVSWEEADAQALPYEDERFDCALSVSGVMFAPDQRTAAAELLRIVRPGGVAVMTAWIPEGTQARAMDVVAGYFPDRPAPSNEWADPEVAREFFAAAGAGDVETRRMSVRWAFDSHSDWRDFVEKGPGPMVAGREELGQERWAAVRGDMAGVLPQPDGPFVIESPYLLITARRP